jgi:hypothetical protein
MFGFKSSWAPLTLLLMALLGFDAWLIAAGKVDLYKLWLATILLIVALCVVAGILVNGRPDGILINDRNRISLGRLQWTARLIVLMSGYFLETMSNVGNGFSLPTMSQDLLGLLGIVSGPTVTAGLISNNKKQSDSPAAPKSAGAAVAPLAATDNPTNVGQMDANKTAAEASWADLYLGEDVGNRYVVDISRLQKFLVTIILVTIYFAWFWQGLGQDHSKGFVEMPGLDGKDTFLWLLGISHAGYLASKATPKTTK